MHARLKYFKNKKQKIDYVTKTIDTYYHCCLLRIKPGYYSVMQPLFVEIQLIIKSSLS